LQELLIYFLVHLLAVAKRESPASKAGLAGFAEPGAYNSGELEGEREMLNWERDDLAF